MDSTTYQRQDSVGPLSESLTAPTPGEIKPQKACVNCRRSKVKCVHEGGPPCRRCIDSKQDCKFRLRADDETWRERTDDKLSKLTNAVDTLFNWSMPPPAAGATASRPANGRSYSSNGLPLSMASSTSTPPVPASPSMAHANGASGSQSSRGMPPPSITSPYSDPIPESHSPSTSIHDEQVSDLNSPAHEKRRSFPRKREAPNDFDSDARLHRSPSSFSGYAPGPSTYSRPWLTASTLGPPPLPPAHLDQDQIMPSPALSHVLVMNAPIQVHGYIGGPRWMAGSTTSYAKATMTIGKEDTRVNVMGLGLISMEQARQLFVYFAEHLQPHSFGFPTYPASEQMTPLITSSILMIASLHDPHFRHLHAPLKQNFLNEGVLQEEVSVDKPLDPELGIGVEEITGACIASAWLGGDTGWRLSRIARWWSIKYLENFEITRCTTMGEMLAILPPFRQIDMVEKLRIWLAAFVAEAQQAFILDRPTLAPTLTPDRYVVALKNAFLNYPSPGASSPSSPPAAGMSASGDAPRRIPPPPDRQLLGHASVLNILLVAQRAQRDSRWPHAANTQTGSSTNANGYRSHNSMTSNVADRVAKLTGLWTGLMDDLERWRQDASAFEELSASTPSALDLSLSYHLSKAHIGSLAVEPEFHLPPPGPQMVQKDAHFQNTQAQVVGSAKASALAALGLASSPHAFRNRLVYLPGWYHFLLGHAAAFLLLLVQRKWYFMVAGEAKVVLETVENFAQIYLVDLANHRFHPHSAQSTHPGWASAEALTRACAHLRAQARSG